MTEILSPQNGSPGDLTQVTGAVPLCDLGPNPDNWIPPAAWVCVTIRGIGDFKPDAAGRFLHCLFEFSHPRVTCCKRRSIVANWAPTDPKVKAQDPIQVECDPGTYWIGTPASLRFLGGRPGDKYDVSVTVDVTRDVQDPEKSVDTFEEPFRYQLTSALTVVGTLALPTPPLWHTYFEIVDGTATVAGIPITTPGQRVPLNMGPIVLTRSGLYRTTGAV